MNASVPRRSVGALPSERGAIHIIAAIFVIVVLLVAYTNIQGWVDKKRAERATGATGPKVAAVRDVFLSPVDALTRIDGEQQRVQSALGLAKSKAEMLALVPKMTAEEKLVAQQKISQVIKQPAELPLDRLIELAFVRWGAVKEYLDAQPPLNK